MFFQQKDVFVKTLDHLIKDNLLILEPPFNVPVCAMADILLASTQLIRVHRGGFLPSSLELHDPQQRIFIRYLDSPERLAIFLRSKKIKKINSEKGMQVADIVNAGRSFLKVEWHTTNEILILFTKANILKFVLNGLREKRITLSQENVDETIDKITKEKIEEIESSLEKLILLEKIAAEIKSEY